MGLFWDTVRKERARGSYFLLHNQFSGERNQAAGEEKGEKEGEGASGCASDQGAKSQAQCLRSARKKRRH